MGFSLAKKQYLRMSAISTVYVNQNLKYPMQNWKAEVKFIDFSKDIPIAIIHMTWPYHMDSSGHELSFLVMHAAYFYICV